jgi:hypothetical protein
MEGPGAWGCDTLLPDGHERPAVERDPAAHPVGLASITEQTNGRVMDAQSKPNRRLVPGHLTEAERLIYNVINHHYETRIVAPSAARQGRCWVCPPLAQPP